MTDSVESMYYDDVFLCVSYSGVIFNNRERVIVVRSVVFPNRIPSSSIIGPRWNE